MTAIPPRLPALVAEYDGRSQGFVRFRPTTWERTLAAAPSGSTRLLRSPEYTAPAEAKRPARPGDRTVDRPSLLAACEAIQLERPGSVLPVFVLTMAWGSGTSGSRALRHTASALNGPELAARVLSASAATLRAAVTTEDGALEAAHRAFRLPGVREAFFTKWFTFAGHVPDRAWQPLILDSRVRATLRWLEVDLTDLAGSHNSGHRYRAYVEAVHGWAHGLREVGVAVDAQRLEWILFANNGASAKA